MSLVPAEFVDDCGFPLLLLPDLGVDNCLMPFLYFICVVVFNSFEGYGRLNLF